MSLRVRVVGLMTALCLIPCAAGAQSSQTEHSVIKPMPGTVVAGRPRFEQHAEMRLTYREGGKTVTKTAAGRHWNLTYLFNNAAGKRDTSRSPAEIVANYEAEANRVGGTIHAKSGTRLTFSLPRPDGNRTWCVVYASPGFYRLDIVDEEPLQTTLKFGAEEMRAALDKDGHVALYGILFDTDKATLRPESDRDLGEIVRLLTLVPGLRLEVQGHTDSTGTAARNRELSRLRAEAVVAALVKRGINASRLVAMGYGADKPVADNATEEGKQKNRRVELVKIAGS